MIPSISASSQNQIFSYLDHFVDFCKKVYTAVYDFFVNIIDKIIEFLSCSHPLNFQAEKLASEQIGKYQNLFSERDMVEFAKKAWELHLQTLSEEDRKTAMEDFDTLTDFHTFAFTLVKGYIFSGNLNRFPCFWQKEQYEVDMPEIRFLGLTILTGGPKTHYRQTHCFYELSRLQNRLNQDLSPKDRKKVLLGIPDPETEAAALIREMKALASRLIQANENFNNLASQVNQELFPE